MPRSRIAGVRRECADCGAHVMARARRGNLPRICPVCGGWELLRVEDRKANR